MNAVFIELYQQALAIHQKFGNRSGEMRVLSHSQLRQIPESDRTSTQQQRLTALVANQQNLVQWFDQFLDRPDVIEAMNQLSRTAQRQNLELQHLNALQDNLRNLQNAVLLYPLILDDRLALVLVTPYAPPIRRTVNVKDRELNKTEFLGAGSMAKPCSPLPKIRF